MPSGSLCVSGRISVVGTPPSVFRFTLQLKLPGSICRPEAGDCDLAEYCTGLSASCPTDSYTQNGLPCNRGKGYCYNGECPSRQQHCKRLWGPGRTPSNYTLLSAHHFNSATSRLQFCVFHMILFKMLKLLQIPVSTSTEAAKTLGFSEDVHSSKLLNGTAL